MSHLIITPQQAELIRGNHGKYSAIEPIKIDDENYLIPESILSDNDLSDAWVLIPEDAPRKTIEEIKQMFPDFQKEEEII